MTTTPGQDGDPDQEGDEVYAIAWAEAADGRLLLTTVGDTVIAALVALAWPDVNGGRQ